MERFAAAVLYFVTSRSSSAYRAALSLLLAWAALMAVLTLRPGVASQLDMPWDTVSMLDGAYRMHAGQIPQNDFFSPIGIVPIWLIELGMKWGGVNANAIAYGSVIAFLVLTPLAWAMAARRLPAFPALLFAMLVGGLLIAKRPLAFGTDGYVFEFSHLSYAMWYNRVGWALLTLYALYWLIRPFFPGRRGVAVAESIAAGALAALLVFSKVNYLAGAALVTFAGLCLALPTWRQLLGGLAGFAAVPALLTFTTGWTVQAWWADLLRLAQVAGAGNRGANYAEILGHNLPGLLLVAASAWLFWPLWTGPAWRGDGWLRTLTLCAASVAAGMGVMLLNTQKTEVPLFVVACLIALRAALGRFETGAVSETGRFRLILGACLGLGLLVNTLVPDCASVGYAWAARNHLRYLIPEGGIVAAPPLAPMLLPPHRHEQVERAWVLNDLLIRPRLSAAGAERLWVTAYQFAYIINDGLDLLKNRTTPQSRIFALNHTNPFPMALQLPPPAGGCLWWDTVTFNRARHPDPARVFGDATHVMVRKFNAGSFALEEIYLPYVQSHFQKLAESPLWVLYGREAAAK